VLTYFAVFAAIVICLGWMIARFHEWRQDMLYGRYAGQEAKPRSRRR
jgi:hypothetical protein